METGKPLKVTEIDSISILLITPNSVEPKIYLLTLAPDVFETTIGSEEIGVTISLNCSESKTIFDQS